MTNIFSPNSIIKVRWVNEGGRVVPELPCYRPDEELTLEWKGEKIIRHTSKLFVDTVENWGDEDDQYVRLSNGKAIYIGDRIGDHLKASSYTRVEMLKDLEGPLELMEGYARKTDTQKTFEQALNTHQGQLKLGLP